MYLYMYLGLKWGCPGLRLMYVSPVWFKLISASPPPPPPSPTIYAWSVRIFVWNNKKIIVLMKVTCITGYVDCCIVVCSVRSVECSHQSTRRWKRIAPFRCYKSTVLFVNYLTAFSAIDMLCCVRNNFYHKSLFADLRFDPPRAGIYSHLTEMCKLHTCSNKKAFVL